ncbi:PRTRC system ParB family protein [Sphingomonas sp. 2R-10]|uniref:PRTRC system ParB family protein n=1 Tax=Sphingomonas sp. 2R-10 TaxID=3045148 RepID=UPI000F77CD5B|nr:PRTRC system ParB family protein [Sphingomonas sp. 2R-10]MDJ0276309.1 PRTRC system ParB family protein [Sphingomonas sp. 2R-10]
MLALSRMVKGRNPRRYFDRATHDELVVSIRLRGIIQPIVLRPWPGSGDLFEIVAGERRYRAALEVYGPDGEVPVVVREMTDEEALEAAIDENDVRDDASETEQADAAVRRLAACGNDRAETARRLGWSRAKLDRRLALADLSETVKCALDERRIKVGHAELLAVIPADKQDKALDTILNARLDVAKTRELLMRVTQNLASACFDKGECTACPFNSAAQAVLFETHVDDGHCTNAACFELKTQAAEAIRFEQQEQAERLAKAAQPAPAAVDAGEPDDEDIEGHDIEGDEADDDGLEHARGDAATDDREPASSTTAAPARIAAVAPAPTPPAIAASRASLTAGPCVTSTSIAARTAEYREAAWRTALARALAGNADNARITILIAAMSGTLSQIKADTLISRAGVLIGAPFAGLDYPAQIAAIRALAGAQATNILSVIGAAYAKDVHRFGHVADLARAFYVDLRDSWQVDRAFLERYTKDELSFLARECGLVAHMGEKAFAKLLAAKKTDLVTAMLNRPGFAWPGRLPGSMTFDGAYGPPPDRAPASASPPITALAA